MSWTTPHTWLVGELADAALMNTHLRDNLGFLYDPPSWKVTRSTTLAIGLTAPTLIEYDGETWDNDGVFSATNSDVAIVTEGIYMMALQTSWTNTTTHAQAGIRRSTTDFPFAEVVSSVVVASSLKRFHQTTGMIGAKASEVLQTFAFAYSASTSLAADSGSVVRWWGLHTGGRGGFV